MIDTKVKVNGKTVGEYDLVKEPCVKKINGEGPDDVGNVEVASDFELPEGVPYKKSYVVKRSEYTGEEITAGNYQYVSTLTPTFDELSANGKVIFDTILEGTRVNLMSAALIEEGTDSYTDNDQMVAVAFADNAVLDDGTVLPKAGIYFSSIMECTVTELSWSVINKLPSDLIPNGFMPLAVFNSDGNTGRCSLSYDDFCNYLDKYGIVPAIDIGVIGSDGIAYIRNITDRRDAVIPGIFMTFSTLDGVAHNRFYKSDGTLVMNDPNERPVS